MVFNWYRNTSHARPGIPRGYSEIEVAAEWTGCKRTFLMGKIAWLLWTLVKIRLFVASFVEMSSVYYEIRTYADKRLAGGLWMRCGKVKVNWDCARGTWIGISGEGKTRLWTRKAKEEWYMHCVQCGVMQWCEGLATFSARVRGARLMRCSILGTSPCLAVILMVG